MEIEVIVENDGSITIRYNGFMGRACFDEATRLYNMLTSMGLNVRVVKVEETPSTYTESKSRINI